MDILKLIKKLSSQKKKKSSVKGTAIGAGIGAALGTVAGMLFAPKSGKENRKTVVEGAKKAAKAMNDAAEKVKDINIKNLIKKETTEETNKDE